MTDPAVSLISGFTLNTICGQTNYYITVLHRIILNCFTTHAVVFYLPMHQDTIYSNVIVYSDTGKHKATKECGHPHPMWPSTATKVYHLSQFNMLRLRKF